ncbi:isoleucine--tRNA ligase, cytoplasmic [Anopheles ziemanni]|uniref:isoleucine--tRNA ligase, cytoplasmic n=1 Tax=Anopheles coustani TaxID=139045 RepID=UPI00265ABCDF|nr:isoleucine--tRNA ligase, cytoplasmic [Anopheles coustani]XP_058172191.1 isoleucine--tRNA ligase, cytoplasmic [Anopheles ziemanni]
MAGGMNNITTDEMTRLPEAINFPAEEEKVLAYWQTEKVFETCLKQSKGKPRYTFYDGPPFATGLPHYGHILAGTVKDIVTRYAHQQGYHVERRFGWDCHGLPVEYEIDKTLNIRGPDDVAKMGIKAYNNECRKIVMRYANEWEQIVGRMGRWIDFKNDYKTLYPWYMESIWWVFKQLYSKGFVYQGVKVMPYSTACTTALSNFESGQNYKEVTDPAVFVSFPLVGDKDGAALVGWTTTPWTLPSNLACCVHPELVYVRVRETKTSKVYILMECRVEALLKGPENYEILDRFPGAKLAGARYEPLFDYFRKYDSVAFRVLTDTYVTEESGTGVVHQAPYFGEDDYRVCLANGVIKRDQEIVCPVDASGKFVDPVTDFCGQYVKDADKAIIKLLKERGRLVLASQVKHNYPFCWRSDTPLIYKAVPSWFVRVEHMNQQLLNCSSQTYWVPEYVKEKRFGNWLRDARDWAISRNRYWGTPIPLWISPDGKEIVCIGSIDELERYSGVRVTDLHRESIDHIEIPSAVPGNPPLRRVTEVFDCWFESGSMPFAQSHYPFENPAEFMNNFPADFIAEGIDQTRGWFYTLLVISTALFNKAPFKNLNVTGLVLAADGQKMSKRKKNYPDPMEVVNKYGADALRLYLINSPVVRAENLRFKEEGVRDIIKDVFLPWFNAFRFLFQNVDRFAKEEGIVYRYDPVRHAERRSTNVMDVWIISFKESLLKFVTEEMKAYRLYTVVPRLTKFIDQLTNWYVRMNRKRIKGEYGVEDCYHALDTLYDVLLAMVKMMAPFTPYLTEFMYQRLRLLSKEPMDGSVHYQMMPSSNGKYINISIERAVARMQAVVELGRVMRDRRTMPIKYPLTEVIVVHQSEEYLADIRSLEGFILGELNVRRITLSSERQRYGVKMRAEADHKTLGVRLKNDFKQVLTAIKQLSDEEISRQLAQGHFTIAGHRVELEEIRLIYQFSGENASFEAHSDNDVLVLLDMTPNEELMREGTAREIINRIQKLKKKAKLIPTDPVLIYYTVAGGDGEVRSVAESHQSYIVSTVKSPFATYGPEAATKPVLIEESQELKGSTLTITICSPQDREVPAAPWVNLHLDERLVPRYQGQGVSSHKASLLLAGSRTGQALTYAQLRQEVESLFGLKDVRFNVLAGANGKLLTDGAKLDVAQLNRQTLYVTQGESLPASGWTPPNMPFAAFRNVNGADGRKTTVFEENPVGVKRTVLAQ